MMRIKLHRLALILAVSSLLAVRVLAADMITAIEAGRHIGETRTVCGTVASAHFAARTRGHPTFLNLDRPYPNQVFTVVIWGEYRPRFSSPPELMFQGKTVCVAGLIRSYRGRPEIIVADPTQIQTEKD